MSNASELERIYDAEVVQEDEGDVWEASVSEWAAGASQAIVGALRQARAAAAVCKVHGTGSMQKFAQEVGTSKSTAYSYAKCWFVYGHLIEDGDNAFSRRLESGQLTMTHLIEATRADNPVGMIEEAEDEGLSSRAIKARVEEEREEEKASDPRVIKVETMPCPRCHGEGVVPVEGGE